MEVESRRLRPQRGKTGATGLETTTSTNDLSQLAAVNLSPTWQISFHRVGKSTSGVKTLWAGTGFKCSLLAEGCGRNCSEASRKCWSCRYYEQEISHSNSLIRDQRNKASRETQKPAENKKTVLLSPE